MVLDVGAKIIDILDFSFSDGAPPLGALVDDTKIKIGPGPSYIIRKGETIKLTILTEGPVQELRWELPFTGVSDGVPSDQDPRWIQRLGLGLFVTVLFTLFIYSLKLKPIVTARPLFLFVALVEVAFYVPAIIMVKLRQRQDLLD